MSNCPKFLPGEPCLAPCFGGASNSIIGVWVVEYVVLILKIFGCVVYAASRPDISILMIVLCGLGLWALFSMMKIHKDQDPDHLFPYLAWKGTVLALESFILFFSLVIFAAVAVNYKEEDLNEEQKELKYRLTWLVVLGSVSTMIGLWFFLFILRCRSFYESRKNLFVTPEPIASTVSPSYASRWLFERPIIDLQTLSNPPSYEEATAATSGGQGMKQETEFGKVAKKITHETLKMKY